MNIGEVCWGINESKECMGEKKYVSGRLNVAINAPMRAKNGPNTPLAPPSQTQITKIKDLEPQGIKWGAHVLGWPTKAFL